MKMSRFSRSTVTIALAVLLGACGTRQVSHGIDADGRADEVVFPDMSRIVLKGGTFPDVSALRAVGPGMTKDQIYHLLGRPHFREGYAGVREWDYLFHFRTPDGVVDCQYKIIFDEDYLGQGFHWMPAACSELLGEHRPEPTVASEHVSQSFNVSFAFSRSGVEDIPSAERGKLETIAGRIASMDDLRVTIVSHTDRIGSEQANLALSQRRGETVKQFLTDRGVLAQAITVRAEGERFPVTTGCDEGLPQHVLANCLAPDRRVELQISGAAPHYG